MQLLESVSNPGVAEDVEKLNTLHSIYRQPARLGSFSVKDGTLQMKDIFEHDTKYLNLRIVPSSLCNVVFIAFRANPIGAHFNSWDTFHRIRERFFWPGLVQYCK